MSKIRLFAGLMIGSSILMGCGSDGASHNPGGDIDLAQEFKKEKSMFPPPNSLPYVVSVAAPMAEIGQDFSKDNVTQAANLVADWQIRHQDEFLQSPLVTFQGTSRYSFGGWLMGTMAIGMTQWGKQANTDKYTQFILDEAKKANYKVEVRVFDADDYTTGQAYLTLNDDHPGQIDLKPLKQRLDYIYENWPTVNKESHPSCLTLDNICRERWTWIDALFMGGPVWMHMAKTTGEEKYLQFAEAEYWATINAFLDKEEGLLYRDSRFVGQPDPYGKKVFWSRGNGWVAASAARMLEVLSDKSNKKQDYQQLLRTMAKALAKAQQADGSWHSSLLNPERYDMPENSGSAFFVYALAWGINNGVLDKETYFPVVKQGWQSIVRYIYADGRLGFVQPSGYNPRHVRQEDTDVYGVGAFLLASSEVIKLAR
ncbi:glycoside hydrolase family 105 protein [Paraferrimonas sp. SM1919]|uniref:glycoside hydrolase family 88/105 protein n=1 Tax=Paraferrimonas sp. SM1919 TaxID=2662263 RepID=UPI0013D7B842|nr:glycoside hydrolase family 88 protein [Paraferrimonas sp. SM1919]